MKFRPKFNVAFDPWIRVRWKDGTLGRVSMADAIRRAREIAAIESQWPLADVAALRVLVTALRRVARPKTTREWVDLLTNGPPVDDFVVYLERWKDRFNLFDESRPFGQYPLGFGGDPDDMSLEYSISMARCVPLMAAGPNPVFFDRRRCGSGTLADGEGIDDENGWPVDFGDAALLMVSLQSWSFAGGNNSPHHLCRGPMLGSSAIVNWISGRDLAETLALNTVSDEIEPVPEGDAPCWEQELVHPTKKNYQRDYYGPLDFGFFLSRRVHLIPREDGKVAKFVMRMGFVAPEIFADKKLNIVPKEKKGPDDKNIRMNPWVAYASDEFGRPMPARADGTAGALWRNASVLLGTLNGSRPPIQLVQLKAAVSSKLIEKPPVRVWGVIPGVDGTCNQLESLHVEQLELPGRWPDGLAALDEALRFFEAKVRNARVLAWKVMAGAMTTSNGRSPESRDVTSAVNGHYIEESMNLRSRPYYPMLQQIADGDSGLLEDWKDVVRSAYGDTIGRFKHRMPTEAATFRAIALNTPIGTGA